MKSHLITHLIESSIQVKNALLNDKEILNGISLASDKITEAFRNGKKVLFCGNGGSAADAQHIAAELSGRFYTDRPPLFAEALHVNTSYLTAVANDYSFDVVYQRLIQAFGQEGDILVGITTSGNSTNVVLAMEEARSRGMITIGMTGEKGGKLNACSDIILRVPSQDTPRIQECHILIGHILCQMIEEEIFPKR
ncbi:MAG: hypothetical protein RLZZ630_1695 [Bacteroidota bacterium]|jgi:D-sedoheptulose 7-phosphate isomerase